MSSIAVLPRFLGALFYYPPTHPDVQAIVASLFCAAHAVTVD